MLPARYLLPLIALTAFSAAADPAPAEFAVPSMDAGYLSSDIRQEMQAALDHYRRSGDARYATPAHGVTALHAAAALHQFPLVQELLAKGADPNALAFIREREEEENGFIDEDGDGEDEVDEEEEGEEEEEADGEIADTPLTLALSNFISPPAPAAEVRPIVQALLAGGADPAAKGRGVFGVLTACVDGCAAIRYADSEEDDPAPDPAEERRWQDIAMLLIDKGAGGSGNEAADCLIYSRDWAPVVIHLLASPQGRALQSSPELLEHIATFAASDDADGSASALLPCARAMRLTPEMLNRPFCVDGERALAMLSESLYKAETEWERDISAREFFTPGEPAPAFVDLLALLLEKGADAQLPMADDGSPVCAADFIACAPAVQAELQRRGFKVAPPPHVFTLENLDALLSDIPLAAISDDEVRAHRELFESCALGRAEFWSVGDAGRALMLLYRLDPEGTRKLVCDRDFWKKPELWRHGRRYAAVAGDAVDSLREASTLVLPPRWIADVAWLAERVYPGDIKPYSGQDEGPFAEVGNPFRLARTLVRLLERDDSAEADAVLEELCARQTPLALRSAAWSARLRRDGLPDLCDSELNLWLGRAAALLPAGQLGPELVLLRRADLAAHSIFPRGLRTRYLFPEDPLAKDTRAVAEALRSLGAPRAAEAYEGALTRPVDDTQDEPDADADYEEEDERIPDDDLRFTALMELEEAYARYFWEHREKLRARRESLPRRGEADYRAVYEDD